MTLHDPSGATYTIHAAKMSPQPRGQFLLENGVVPLTRAAAPKLPPTRLCGGRTSGFTRWRARTT